MRIDVHCHFTPKEYFEILHGRDTPVAAQVSAAAAATWETAEDRIRAMDQAGVDVEVLSLTSPGVFFPDKGLSVCLAQMANDKLADICQSNPTRFLGFASVPLPHVDAAIVELHRALSKQAMVGVVLASNILGKPLDADEFRPFFQEADLLGLTVFIHPGLPPGMPNPEQFNLGVVVGFPFDSVVAATRLALSGTLERFPRISFVLSHLGGAIPFLYGRLDSLFELYDSARACTSTKPSDQFRRLYYDTALSYRQSSLMCAYDFLGPDHIVLGTDYPMAAPELMRTVGAIESIGLPPEAREEIFSGTARRILRLPPQMVEAYSG